MATYLRLFETESEYIEFMNSDEFVRPNLSYVVSDGDVKFHSEPSYPDEPQLDHTVTLTFNATQDNLLAFRDTLSNVKRITVDGNEIELSEPIEHKFTLRSNETFEYFVESSKMTGSTSNIFELLYPVDINSEIIIKPTNISDIENITEIYLMGYADGQMGFYFADIDKCEEDGFFIIKDRETLTLSLNPLKQKELAVMGSQLCYVFGSKETVGTTITAIYYDTTVIYNTADIICATPGYDLSITPIDKNMVFTNDTIVTLYIYNSESETISETYNGPISNSILNDKTYATVSDKEILVNETTIRELSTMDVFLSFTFTNPDETPLLVNYSYNMGSFYLKEPLYFDKEGEHTIIMELKDSILTNFVNLNQDAIVSCEMQGVTEIGSVVFTNCEYLEYVNLGDTLEKIGDYAFNGCYSLNNVTFPDTVKSIGVNAFRFCTGWTGELILPENLEYIGDEAFYNCKGLGGELVIPNAITDIYYCTFYQISITSLVLPEKLINIGEIAFQGCHNLTSITCNAMVAPTIQSNTFRYLPDYGTLYYPEGATGYEAWISTSNYYLGYYNWTSQEI